jgi:hypothetical protein
MDQGDSRGRGSGNQLMKARRYIGMPARRHDKVWFQPQCLKAGPCIEDTRKRLLVSARGVQTSQAPADGNCSLEVYLTGE